MASVRSVLSMTVLFGLALSAAAFAGEGEAPLRFAILGDVPYTAAELPRLQALARGFGAAGLSWVVHTGNLKAPETPCTDAAYRPVHELFATATVPWLYTPGSNDWIDCREPAAGGYDPVERLGQLRKIFYPPAPGSRLAADLHLVSQAEEDPAYPEFVENLRWNAQGVWFVTVNVGGRNNGLRVHEAEAAAEFGRRMNADLAWLKHAFALAEATGARGLAIFMNGDPLFPTKMNKVNGYTRLIATLRTRGAQFKRPILLVHGGGRSYVLDHPLKRFTLSRQKLPGFTRLQTPGSPQVAAVLVRVEPPGKAGAAEAAELFHFEQKTEEKHP